MKLDDLSAAHADILRVASRIEGDDREALYSAATVFHNLIVAMIAIKRLTNDSTN